MGSFEVAPSCPKFGRKMCRVNFSHNIRVTLFAVLLDGDYSNYYLDSLSSFYRVTGCKGCGLRVVFSRLAFPKLEKIKFTEFLPRI